MGYIKHDAIIVTSPFRRDLELSRGIAEELGLRPTAIAESGSNYYASFLIPPDGSKEGWEESDAGDRARNEWKNWAKEARLRPGSAAIYTSWVHVSYAGDEATDTKVVDHHKLHPEEDES